MRDQARLVALEFLTEYVTRGVSARAINQGHPHCRTPDYQIDVRKGYVLEVQRVHGHMCREQFDLNDLWQECHDRQLALL